MIALFRYTLRGLTGAVLGWGLLLGVLAGYLVPFYDSIYQQWDQWKRLLEGYPKELLVFFGDVSNLADPANYFQTEFFSWVPLLLGFYSALVGSSLLAELEESGRLDLLLAQPIGRIGFLAARFAAYLTATLAILALNWAGFVVGMPFSQYLGISPWQFAPPLVSLLALLLFFGNLALLLSMCLPSRRAAAFLCGAAIIASFFITGLSKMDNSLELAGRLSPFTYYQGAEAMHGINTTWLAGLLAASALFLLLAAWRFRRRDIRVSGEGSWPFQGWILRLPRRQPAR